MKRTLPGLAVALVGVLLVRLLVTGEATFLVGPLVRAAGRDGGRPCRSPGHGARQVQRRAAGGRGRPLPGTETPAHEHGHKWGTFRDEFVGEFAKAAGWLVVSAAPCSEADALWRFR